MADRLANPGATRPLYGSVLLHKGIVAEPKQHDDHLLGQGDDPEVQWNRRGRNRSVFVVAMRSPPVKNA